MGAVELNGLTKLRQILSCGDVHDLTYAYEEAAVCMLESLTYSLKHLHSFTEESFLDFVLCGTFGLHYPSRFSSNQLQGTEPDVSV